MSGIDNPNWKKPPPSTHSALGGMGLLASDRAEGMITTLLASQIAEAVRKDEAPEAGGCDLSAGLFGPNMSALIRDLAKQLSRPSTSSKCRGLPDSNCAYLAHCDGVCNKCGRQHDGKVKS